MDPLHQRSSPAQSHDARSSCESINQEDNSGTWRSVDGEPLVDIVNKTTDDKTTSQERIQDLKIAKDFSNLLTQDSGDNLSDSLEIRVNKKNLINQDGSINLDTKFSKPTGLGSSLKMAWRSVCRLFSSEERNANRDGMKEVKKFLLTKYDTFAVERFDKHFAWREYTGKPLTVRALKVFLVDEEKRSKASFPLPPLSDHLKSLENLENSLPQSHNNPLDANNDRRNISAPKSDEKDEVHPLKERSFVMAIYDSSFSSAADAQAIRDANKAGIQAVKEEIMKVLSNEREKKAVEAIFNQSFESKIEKGEPLTVAELRSILDQAIKERNDADSIISRVMKLGHEKLEQVSADISTFFSNIGLGLETAAVAKVAIDADNPIVGAIEAAATTAALAAEDKVSPLAAIITASLLLMHSPPAHDKSWFSQLLPYLGLAALA